MEPETRPPKEHRDRRPARRALRSLLNYLDFERIEPATAEAPKSTGLPGIKLVWVALGLLASFWASTLTGMPEQARMMLAIALPMGIWWITEALPISITALLPLVLLPVFGIVKPRAAAAPYADPNVFLFIGGFILAACMQKWGLHRRMALLILLRLGSSPKRILLACMGVTAFLSMWASNTATVLMMFPIALALVDSGTSESEAARKNFTVCLLLGIAYAGSMGGIATLIGTPPNIVFASVSRRLEVGIPEVSFLNWMGVGIPLSLIMLVLIYQILTRILYRFDAKVFKTDVDKLRKDLAELGPMSPGEKYIAGLFSFTALLWITRKNIVLGSVTIPGWSNLLPYGGYIHDGTVAIAMAMILFVVPVDLKRGVFMMDRDWYKSIPWDIVLLFGGGFALAQGFTKSGLSTILGEQLSFLGGLPVLVMMIGICLFMTFVTELTSNTSTTTVMLPILAATATATGQNPLLLMLPATFAASAAFMLPVATPPNAIVFGSGRITIPQMVRAGILINIISAPIIALVTWWLGPIMLG